MSGRFDPELLPAWPDLSLERALWACGLATIAGVDEAGRGALAGPVAAAALILPPEPGRLKALDGLRDSKKLSPAERAAWASVLRQVATAWGVGYASEREIDLYGILPATRLAAQRALSSLPVPPQHLLLDCLFLPDDPTPQTSLIKGDERSLCIAGASVLAKTSRDALLQEMELAYPGYGFAAHKGYGTRAHLQALRELGPCPTHRKSFAPIKTSLCAKT